MRGAAGARLRAAASTTAARLAERLQRGRQVRRQPVLLRVGVGGQGQCQLSTVVHVGQAQYPVRHAQLDGVFSDAQITAGNLIVGLEAFVTNRATSNWRGDSCWKMAGIKALLSPLEPVSLEVVRGGRRTASMSGEVVNGVGQEL